MRTNRRRHAAARVAVTAAGIGLAIVASQAPARGADAEPSRAATGVALRVDSIPPGQSVAVEKFSRHMHGLPPEVVMECFDGCNAVVDPGRYRLNLRGANNDTIGTAVVRVRQPVAYRVVPLNRGVRDVGVAMGVVGPILFASGVVAFLFGGWGGTGSYVYSAIATPVGIVTGFAGWIMYINNDTFFRRENVKPSDGGALSAGLAAIPRGPSAAFSARF